jgi:formylmethanofuran dehydrogenase subunit D
MPSKLYRTGSQPTQNAEVIVLRVQTSSVIRTNEVQLDATDMRLLGVVEGGEVEVSGWGKTIRFRGCEQRSDPTPGTVRISELGQIDLCTVDGQSRGNVHDLLKGLNVSVTKATMEGAAIEYKVCKPQKAWLPSCGKQLPPDASYCDGCGEKQG